MGQKARFFFFFLMMIFTAPKWEDFLVSLLSMNGLEQMTSGPSCCVYVSVVCIGLHKYAHILS